MTNILVNIGDDNPDRGDTHGYIGLAKEVARQMGARFAYVDAGFLETRFNTLADGGARLKAYLKQNPPNIVFQSPNASFEYQLRQHEYGDRCRLRLSHINESFGNDYLNPCFELVATHITPEGLGIAGAEFRAHYPDLLHPIVAVLLARGMPGPADLLNLLEKEPRATIFVSSCHRTSDIDYRLVTEGLALQKARRGLDHIEIVTHDQRHAAPSDYNPYLGLLHEADHFVVGGYSVSMISEILAAGKTPHEYRYKGMGEFVGLKNRGLVRDFSEAVKRGVLQTDIIAPVTVTSQIAAAIIAQYEANVRAHREREVQYIFQSDIDASPLDIIANTQTPSPAPS